MSPKHLSTRFGSRTGLRLVLPSLLLCGLLLTGWPQAVAGQVSATVTENTPDRIVVQYIFGEPTMAGWTVYLDIDTDGTLDAGEPSQVTDAAIGTRAAAETMLTASNSVDSSVGNLRAEIESFLSKVAV